MKLNFFEKLIGSGLYTGYIPLASGTFGSIAGLAIYYIPGFENPLILISAIFIFSFYGTYVGSKFEKVYGKDPAECTIDEVVGMWISLLYLPKSFWISAVAFLIWRVMDIVKPFPAKKLEAMPGGFGIMMDDIVSAFYASLTVNIILFVYSRL